MNLDKKEKKPQITKFDQICLKYGITSIRSSLHAFLNFHPEDVINK